MLTPSIPAVENGKVFLVLRGALEGRFDAGYYKPEIMAFISHLESLSNTHRLKGFIRRINTGFNNIQNESNEGVRFLRTQNVRPIYLDVRDATFTVDSNIRLAPVGSLLFTRIGVNVGDVSFNNFDQVAFSDNVICAELENDSLAYYIAIFLSTEKGKMLLERQKRDTARPIISYENIKNLLIPIIPDIHLVIEKIEAAYASKRAKEAEAASLLASIDGYLLEALGITLPEVTEKKKMFFVCSDKVSGGRFDPQFYKPEYLELIDAINKCPNERLYHLVKFSSETWNQKDYFNEHFPYIEISEINLSKGTISNVSQIELSEAPSRAKMIVREGDIIVSTTRPSRGAIAKISANEDFSIASTGFAVIRYFDKKRIFPEFLHAILRHRLCLIQLEQRSSGGNYPAITQEELGNIKIPIPSILVQQEIVSHIQTVLEKAQQLEAEAKAAVEAAKMEVEAMILGEGGSGA